jgi:Family of unknown function (DUF6278)
MDRGRGTSQGPRHRLMSMGISFLDRWRKRYGEVRGAAVPQSLAEDPAGVAELLSECELLRARAEAEGVELDDTAGSLECLDQMVPHWRDDPDEQSWLGNDAGLYLGTVVVRTVPGASWRIWPNGRPVVQLVSGRELDVVEAGHEWAESGTPELSQVYAEASEP